MRKIQTLHPRVFNSIEDAIKDLIRFENKFKAINQDNKKLAQSKIIYGDEARLEIDIYEL